MQVTTDTIDAAITAVQSATTSDEILTVMSPRAWRLRVWESAYRAFGVSFAFQDCHDVGRSFASSLIEAIREAAMVALEVERSSTPTLRKRLRISER